MSNFGDRLNDVFRDEAYRPMNDDNLVAVVTHRAGRRRARFHGLFALVASLVLAGAAAIVWQYEPPNADPAAPTPSPTINDLRLLSDVPFDYDGTLDELQELFSPPRCGDVFVPAPSTGANLSIEWEQSSDEPAGGESIAVSSSLRNDGDVPATAVVRDGGVIVVRDGIVVQTDNMIPHLRLETVPPGGRGEPREHFVAEPELCPGAALTLGTYQVYSWATVSLGPEAGAARVLVDSGLGSLEELGASPGIGTTQAGVPAALAQYCVFSYIDLATDPDNPDVIESTEAPNWDTYAHPELGYLYDMNCDVPDAALAEFQRVAVPTTYVNDEAAVVLISEPLTISRE